MIYNNMLNNRSISSPNNSNCEYVAKQLTPLHLRTDFSSQQGHRTVASLCDRFAASVNRSIVDVIFNRATFGIARRSEPRTHTAGNNRKYQRAPLFINIDNSDHSVNMFNSINTTNITQHSSSSSSSTKNSEEEENRMSGQAALWIGGAALAVAVGSISLLFSTMSQLSRDRALFQEVREGHEKLLGLHNRLPQQYTNQNEGADPVLGLIGLTDSLGENYAMMEFELSRRVNQEYALLATGLFAFAGAMMGLSAAFRRSWNLGRGFGISICGSVLLLTVTCAMGSNSEERKIFMEDLAGGHRYRNKALDIQDANAEQKWNPISIAGVVHRHFCKKKPGGSPFDGASAPPWDSNNLSNIPGYHADPSNEVSRDYNNSSDNDY